MRKYSVSSYTLSTGRTLFNVVDDSGFVVSGASTEENCEALASMLNDKQIQSNADWDRLDSKIRKAYIFSFCALRPNF